ncbi:profilin-2-like [Notothenia coriiceps]|uniref:Profilin n=1 Tax=Notothenia coriiceps TaxID=8208 RepID=A0A6I9NGZ3_9TELE|nr:PREDICTED: profilin-2-like [Notothenia coriiceps]
MSWQSYVDNLMADGSCQDTAIVGYTDAKYVWASSVGGTFANITPEEIDVITGKDREAFFCGGMTLGNKKCSVIRDSLPVDGDWTMDIRTKSSGGEPTYNISVGRAGKAWVCTNAVVCFLNKKRKKNNVVRIFFRYSHPYLPCSFSFFCNHSTHYCLVSVSFIKKS